MGKWLNLRCFLESSTNSDTDSLLVADSKCCVFPSLEGKTPDIVQCIIESQRCRKTRPRWPQSEATVRPQQQQISSWDSRVMCCLSQPATVAVLTRKNIQLHWNTTLHVQPCSDIDVPGRLPAPLFILRPLYFIVTGSDAKLFISFWSCIYLCANRNKGLQMTISSSR